MHVYKKSTFDEKYSIEDFPISIPNHGWLFSEIEMTSSEDSHATQAAILNHIDCFLRIQKQQQSDEGKTKESVTNDVLVIDNM